MARLIKAQQVVLSKALCEAVITQLTKKYKNILGTSKIKLLDPQHWNNKADFYKIQFNIPSNPPAKIAAAKDEFTIGNFKTSVSPEGKLKIEYTKPALKRINKATNYFNPVIKDLKRFANKMDKEFLLRTSFDDMSDITLFIKIFTKTFN